MIRIRSVSKSLLVLEAILLIIPTVLGIAFSGSVVVVPIFDPKYPGNVFEMGLGLSVVLVLYSGWLLGFRYLLRGPIIARGSSLFWWACVFAAALTSVASWVAHYFSLFGLFGHTLEAILVVYRYGIFFVIPLLHLSIEVWLNKSINASSISV